MRIHFPFFVLLVFLLSFSVSSLAQTDEEIYQGFQFNFLNPGARAMGMGGAFIGFAGDSTAAFINPAGLIWLDKPQFYAEFKTNSWKTLRAAAADSFSTGTLAEFSSDTYVPSFGSFAFPIGNFTAAVSVTNTINYEEEFILQARPVPGSQTVLPPVNGSISLDGYVFALSVALRLNDYWVFGISSGVSYLNLTTSNSILTTNNQDYTDTSGPVSSETISDGTDTGLFFNFGILFTPAQAFTVGLSFMYHPPMTFSQDLYISGSSETGLHFNTVDITYDVPDRYGLGIAYRPVDGLVIAADAVYIEYSQLTEVMVASHSNDQANVERGDNISSLFEHKDSVELHIGIEYALPITKYPIYLRAGFFTYTNHRPLYLGSDPVLKYRWNISDYSDDIEDIEYGFSGGLGFTLSESISFDTAYVYSDSNTLFLLSVVYRF